ncbi:hypothetical protein CRUP_020588 [Coryphaenoides rupestris]|nr:hypothetical protein CRUP_020588 [Coryphaenoides rupestris]
MFRHVTTHVRKLRSLSVQLRTTPRDSTGVPHILEHTVLCGSERFPCRDPFFKMLNRSLSTFMNAFTASDYTMYPFSTQNSKDFQNLLSVYLDAVFFPCLREQDFRQEGWRLENADPEDPKSPLIFKGVVFNEMKGAFSVSESVYAQQLQNKLFPDHTYSVVFFTYGDLPLEQHLQQIQQEALRRFHRIEPDTWVPPQPAWTSPYLHAARDDSNNLFSVQLRTTPRDSTGVPHILEHTSVSESVYAQQLQNKLFPDHTYSVIQQEALRRFHRIEPDTWVPPQPAWTSPAFTLNLLSSLMVSGPSSPFYRALLEPKIGSDFSSVVGSGFEEERIEALLHKIEIQMKHQSTSFGLALASYIASSWNHDGDPVELLQIGALVSRFRRCLRDDPHFLQDKVKHYFQDNGHRLTLSMSPDESYLERQALAEQEKLRGKTQGLTEPDLKEIYDKGLELLAVQSQPQDASCLPALQVSDIQRTTPPTPDLLAYVPLFCSVITQLGCGSLDYRQQAQQMELRTGGMSVSPLVIPDSAHLDMYEQGILLFSSCLERNVPNMFSLWSDIFNSPHFDDEERLRVLVMMSAQELANGISHSGHMYAMTRAGRSLTPAGALQETFSGMEQVKFMKRIAEMSDLGPVLRALPRIKKHLLNPDSMRCAVNATPQKMSDAAGQLESFMKDVAGNRRSHKTTRPNIVKKMSDAAGQLESFMKDVAGNRRSHKTTRPNIVKRPLEGSAASRKLVSEVGFQPCQMKTFYPMPFPVNFVSESVRTVPFTHADHASLSILARMMTAKYLHGEIREKGGAYGGGARMGSGLFSFYSYRDPNSVQTLSAFRRGADWARSGSFSQQDIDEAKLSVFSAVDAPVAPSDKGMGRFLNGLTDEARQGHRERLFAVSDKDLADVASRYLGFGQQISGAAILGPENEGLKKDPSWIVK